MQNEIKKSLAILLTPNGFSYCTALENDKGRKVKTPINFRVEEAHPQQIEKEIENELKTNLVFHQPYEQINLAFLSHKMQLVPNEYLKIANEQLLQLVGDEEDDTIILDSPLASLDASIVYEIQPFIKDTLLNIDNLKDIQLFHAGQILLDHLEPQAMANEIFLNLNDQILEIVMYRDATLHFYNHFLIESVEDFLYYTLVVIHQLELDVNEVSVKTFGEITNTSDYYIRLKKHIRKLALGLKDEFLCEHFTLYHLL